MKRALEGTKESTLGRKKGTCRAQEGTFHGAKREQVPQGAQNGTSKGVKENLKGAKRALEGIEGNTLGRKRGHIEKKKEHFTAQ